MVGSGGGRGGQRGLLLTSPPPYSYGPEVNATQQEQLSSIELLATQA